MIPCFTLQLHQKIEPGQATVGKFDGKHPQLACATESGKIFLHDSTSSEEPIRFLNINRDVQSVTSGSFNNEEGVENLFVGTENTLLCYDIEKNSDVFYLDVGDGLGSMYFTKDFDSTTPMILVGGNCTISGYDKEGQEIYWNSTGGNVLCMTVDPFTKILYVGADDYCIYQYKGEEMLHEFTESNNITHLVNIGKGFTGFALSDNSFGVYGPDRRLWRKKCKNIITALGAFDINQNGTMELIIGTEQGQIEVRGRKKGKRIYRERLPSSISKILDSDYKMNGKVLLIVCCEDGSVRGYLDEQVQRYLSSVNNFDEEIEILKKRVQSLRYELESYQQNFEKIKTGKVDPGLISHDTQVKCRLRPNLEKRSVEIVFQSDHNTSIKLAIIHAENLFPDGETTKLYYSADPSETMSVALRPEKDISVNLAAKVLVGHALGDCFHVFELSYKMPKFSMYIPVRSFDIEPVGSVSFKLNERISRIALWLNSSFNIVYKHDNKETVNVKFVSLKNGKPLHLLFKGGKMVIKVDSMEVAGELIHDLCAKLNVEFLDSIAIFPDEFALLVENLKKIEEFTKIKSTFSTEMADVTQNLKGLVISAENNRILSNISEMKTDYAQIMDFNRDLIVEYKKREKNQKMLIQNLKNVNHMIMTCSKLRVGEKRKLVVSQIRSQIQKKNFNAIPKIMQYGTLDGVQS